MDALQRRLAERNQKGGQRRFCLDVSMVQRQTVLHYQPRKSRAFFRIVVATPNLVAQSRGNTSQQHHKREYLWLAST